MAPENMGPWLGHDGFRGLGFMHDLEYTVCYEKGVSLGVHLVCVHSYSFRNCKIK